MNPWQTTPGSAATGRRAAVRYHGTRVLLAIGLALVTYVLFPAAPAVDSPLLEIGSVAPDNVIAPFAFRVPKPDAQLARERDQVTRSVSPVLSYVPAAVDSARSQLEAFASGVARAEALARDDAEKRSAVQRAAAVAGVRLTGAEAAVLVYRAQRDAIFTAARRALDERLTAGVAPGGALDSIRGEALVRRGDALQAARTDSLRDFPAYIGRDARAPLPGPADAVYVKLLTAFFHPTLVYDRAATEERRAEFRNAVDAYERQVLAGEKIVGAHEVVGRDEYNKMRALRGAVQAQSGASSMIGRVVGAVLFNAMLIALFGITLVLFRPALYGNLRALLLFAFVFLVVLVGASVVARLEVARPELVPIALAAVVFSVLFDARISMVAAMVLSVLIGGQSDFRGTNALFLALVGGVAAAFGARAIRRRTEALYPILTVATAYVIGALAIGLTLGWTLPQIARSAGWGILNAVVCIPIALQLLLPLGEEFTGIDSYPKLLEWSDLNRPLLQRLSLEAPGTYNHTVVMANLAEAACNAIGANGLLARVGAYYHDIGKLRKPQYFVENQLGRNPHDKLKPATSASIIRNHVREGMELAEEHKVPKAVRAFIAQHHGTVPIAYFLEKARERDGAPSNPAEFAYPGPLPQTAETAVCMLADGVEAAARVLADPTPQRIREVVEHIVRQRMDQGQLREAPLTLAQLEIVKEQFARMLIGQHHNRIDYPQSSGGVTSEFASV